MQILDLFGFDSWFANTTFNIYSWVAKAYTSLIEFADMLGGPQIDEMIKTITNNLYILIGIFMLFRLGISLINYMINPDAIGDKSAGAGKMVTRIVTSFVLLLAAPLIFNLLGDLQSLITGKDGLINNISNIVTTDYTNQTKQVQIGRLFYSDVYADEQLKICNKETLQGVTRGGECAYNEANLKSFLAEYSQTLTKSDADFAECTETRIKNCYKINQIVEKNANYKQKAITSIAPNYIPGTQQYLYTESGMQMPNPAYDSLIYIDNYITYTVKVIEPFQNNSLTCYYRMMDYGEEKVNETSGVKCKKAVCNANIVAIQFTIDSNRGTKIYKGNNASNWSMETLTGSNYSAFTPSKITYSDPWLSSNAVEMLDKGQCPPSIANVNCTGNNCRTSGNESVLNNANENYIGNGLIDGTNSYDDLLNKIASCMTENQKGEGICSETGEIDSGTSDDLKQELEEKTENIMNDKDKTGYEFVRPLLASFVMDEPDMTKAIEIFKDWPNNSADVADRIDKGHIKYQTLIAFIIGIALLIFFIAMAIELVVRNFKLIVLQIIAPIPIISYMNPNDKIFDNWTKQYMGVYLDLFIKLIAIKLVEVLIRIVLQPITASGFFTTIIYITGLVLFIKVIPDFISKIFGIKDMSGSLKDTFGMMKAGFGAAAGGAIGAGAVLANTGRNAYQAYRGGLGARGALTAAASSLLSAPSAMLKGLGAGYKGKVFDSGQEAWKKGTQQGQLYREGVGAGAQVGASVLGGVFSYAENVDRRNKQMEADNKQYEEFSKYKDNMEQIAESSDYMKNLRAQQVREDGTLRYTEDQIRQARTNWIEAQLSGADQFQGLKQGTQIVTGQDGRKYAKEVWRLDAVDNVIEGGKKKGLETTLATAEAKRGGTSTIFSLDHGQTEITSFTDLDTLTKDAKNAKNANDIAIARTHDDRYNASNAARGGNSKK